MRKTVKVNDGSRVWLEGSLPKDGEVFRAKSWRFQMPNGGPIKNCPGGGEFESNSLEIVVGADGHISFSEVNDEGFIYLYPEQVGHLRKALAHIDDGKARGGAR